MKCRRGDLLLQSWEQIRGSYNGQTHPLRLVIFPSPSNNTLHKDRYAILARSDEPAARVGIEFIGRSAVTRNEVREFQHGSSKRSPYYINALFDWVNNEKSIGRPRRKIDLHKPATVNSQGKRTKAFETWVYTDDKGNLEDPQSE